MLALIVCILYWNRYDQSSGWRRHQENRRLQPYLRHIWYPPPDMSSSLAAEGVNLAREYPQSVFQIMHPRTLHIKNPSDAKLASLSILRKWPVSMATIVKNRKIQKVQYLSTYSSYFHNISFWTYGLEQYRSNGGHDLEVPRSISCKNKDPT